MTVAQAFSPAGLKVLLVDDDRVCLKILGKMLRQCNYSVTPCSCAATALSLVKGDENSFDLVLCDVHMPEMDGFKLLEAIGSEDLPVIMMSSDGETEVVMKGIKQGACDYFLKPVGLASLQNIWQHVFRRHYGMRESSKDVDSSNSEIVRVPRFQSEGENCRKRKGKQEATEDLVEYADGLKKSRLIWTEELHKKFVDAVESLGREKAVPKKILEKMSVKGVTREHVASHLQKYRKFLSGMDMEDLISGLNMTKSPVTLDSFQVGGGFGGSIEIQAGGISPPLFPLGAIHPPQPWNPVNYALDTELYPVPSQSFQAVQVGNLRCNGSTDLYPDPSFDVASSSNVELYPIPGISFDVVPNRNVDLYPLPSFDVPPTSNLVSRFRQCQGLGDLFPSTLVPPADIDVVYLTSGLSEGKRRGI